ncbi:hypothetical protein [Dubosiella newyorkensis]|nr:hypothetical protein [Dubosiella newyorkensis]
MRKRRTINNIPLNTSSIAIALHTPGSPKREASKKERTIRTPHMLIKL